MKIQLHKNATLKIGFTDIDGNDAFITISYTRRCIRIMAAEADAKGRKGIIWEDYLDSPYLS